MVALGEIGVFHKGISCFRHQPASPTVVCRPKLTPNPHLSHNLIPYKLGGPNFSFGVCCPTSMQTGVVKLPQPHTIALVVVARRDVEN